MSKSPSLSVYQQEIDCHVSLISNNRLPGIIQASTGVSSRVTQFAELACKMSYECIHVKFQLTEGNNN